MQATKLRASDRCDGGRELAETAHNRYAVFGLERQYSCFGGGCLGSRSGTVGGEAYACICRQHPAGTVISRAGERHILVTGMDEDRTSGTRREAAPRLPGRGGGAVPLYVREARFSKPTVRVDG